MGHLVRAVVPYVRKPAEIILIEVKGTKEQPWVLKTPPGTSEYTMYKDETHNPPILVCTVGKKSCTMIFVASMTCMKCSKSMVIGWN